MRLFCARPIRAYLIAFENFAGTGTIRGVDATEMTLSLSQVTELGGKRALRTEAAGADRDVIAVEQQCRSSARTDWRRTQSSVHACTTVFALNQESGTAQARLATLMKDAVPQAETALVQTRYGYARGVFSFVELSKAQQDVWRCVGGNRHCGRLHQPRTEIERLTSEPLSQQQGAP